MTTDGRADPTGLRIGFVPGVTLTKWRRIWDERFRRVPLTVTEVTEDEQHNQLVNDRLDMCFVRLPIDTNGLHAIPLYEEAPVLWMHKDFLLSALDEVRDADLAEFRIVRDYAPESIDLAVYNAAALHVPLSVARTQSRKDMVHRPYLDAEPTTIALAWRVDNDNEWIDEFIGVVRGRTANSSRTARERGAPAKPTKTPSKPPTPTKRPTPGGRRGKPKNQRGRGR